MHQEAAGGAQPAARGSGARKLGGRATCSAGKVVSGSDTALMSSSAAALWWRASSQAIAGLLGGRGKPAEQKIGSGGGGGRGGGGDYKTSAELAALEAEDGVTSSGAARVHGGTATLAVESVKRSPVGAEKPAHVGMVVERGEVQSCLPRAARRLQIGI